MVISAAIVLIVLIALLVRYRLGFGFSLVFIPSSSLVLGFSYAIRIAIILEIVVGIITVVQFWKDIRWFDSLYLKIASLIGVWIGTNVKPYIPANVIIIVSMLLVIATCVWFYGRLHLSFKRTAFKLFASGLFSGLLNSWSSLSGPPIVIYYLSIEREENKIKGGLASYFLLLYLFTFYSLSSAKEYDGFDKIGIVVCGIVAILLGFPIIKVISRHIRGDFRKISLVFIIVAACLVILQTLF